jgi:type II secretory pathway pseudopilin PulG
MRHRTPTRRPALTLLEVIIALAIFLMAITAIGELLYIGQQRAMEAEQQARGLQRCQSKMSEVISGGIPASNATGNQSFDDDKDWVWSMDSTAQEASNLYLVTITVVRQNTDGPKVEVSLSQMVLDASARNGANAAANNNANNNNGNNTGNGSN